STGRRALSERRKDVRSADPLRSPRAPAPPAGQTRSACPSPRSPARCAPAPSPGGIRPARANSAAPSCRALHHRHQRPHQLGVKSRPHPQTPPILEQNFPSRIACRSRHAGRTLIPRRFRLPPPARSHLHFHELRARNSKHFLPRLRLAQPLLPSKKVRCAQPPL